MITVTITGFEEVRAKLENVFPAARARLRQTTAKLAVDLQRHVVEDKLSGQVLKNRTGTLRRSINQHVEETSESVTGIVGADMNAARYARALEYGVTFLHPGGTAYLKFPDGAVFISNTNALASRAFRTKAHNITQPERSYLRSALKDMRQTILDAFAASLRDALK
jgi:hypothetical protein